MFVVFPLAFQICGIVSLFVLGLAFLQFTWNRNYLSLLSWEGRDVTARPTKQACSVMSIRFVLSRFFKRLRSMETKPARNGLDKKCNSFEGYGTEEEISIEDEISDVILLRKLVKSERRRAEMACAEVKKERMAAASATEEAMAMILKLQSHKSAMEIEANQYRRLVEHKQEMDREVIESLQWIIMKHERVMNDLEIRWRFCREKMKNIVESDVFEELDNGCLISPEFFALDEEEIDLQVAE